MGDILWTAVDDYLEQHLTADDSDASAVLKAQGAAGLPDIAVSPTQGKFLEVLARSIGARRVLEFGTLGGYSTLWLARALPEDGVVVSLELSPEHAAVARASLDKAGVGKRVEIRVGPALDSLPGLEHDDPYDLVFIDADKENGVTYFEAALRRTRPGGLIVVDNVVREGQVADEASTDSRVQGSRRVIEYAAHDPRVEATVIQTVGRKKYDGLLIAVVL
ncbi:MAG: O-methyltransferase [Demequinaceae bacterium]|nr:O-methyltransferase [Demequinaceae bacterium]